DQADHRAVSDCRYWHLHAFGVYPRLAAGASAPGLQRRKSAVSYAHRGRRESVIGREFARCAQLQGWTMLSWEKIDAIPGWFMFQFYCVWRALIDQQTRVTGDLFEIGVWRGRSASVLAAYRKGNEKLYLC